MSNPIVKILLSLLGLAPALVGDVQACIAALKHEGSLTEEEWNAVKIEMDAIMSGPAWQPDPPSGG